MIYQTDRNWENNPHYVFAFPVLFFMADLVPICFFNCSGDVHVHLLLFDLNVIWEAGYVLVGCSLLMQFCMFVALYVFLHICIFFVCIYVCMYVCR